MTDEQQQARRRRRRGRQAAETPEVVAVPEPAPVKPKRSAASRVFYSLFVIFVVAGLAAIVAATFGYQRYIGQGPLTTTKTTELKKGLNTPEIAYELENAGVISNATLFTAAAILTGSRGRLKAGEYEFTPGMSMRDVLGLIVQGKAIVYKVTIPEGWTTEQALDRVRENDVLTGDLTLSPGEGAIFPDTYVFKRGATRDSVVQEMIDAHDKYVDELWEKRGSDLAVKSANEAVTLASIVEKETSLPEERAKVASVFINRLKRRMRLQSDPTIIYGLVGGKGKLDRPLTKQDIALKTPYNTYRVDGLPPGPISNPGKAAIEAVLHPPTTSALYFVADGSGGHAFAETLAEHKKNVAKWREVEKARNAEDAVDELAAEKSGEMVEEGTSETSVTDSTSPGSSKEKVATTQLPAVKAPEAAAKASGTETEKPSIAAEDDPKAAEQTAAIEKPPTVVAPKPPPPQPAQKLTKPDTQPAAAKEQVAVTKTAENAAAAVEAIPLPRKKPRRGPQPGDLVMLSDRLVPIPVPKPKLP